MFHKSSAKEILGNLKKGAQIGVLGTALTAGTVFGVGCSQPAGGNTIENDQDITGGNNGNTGNTGSNLPSQPYDRTIGNGNYVLHNFASDSFLMENFNRLLGQGETYVKGLSNQLDQSLSNRPAARNYLSNLYHQSTK